MTRDERRALLGEDLVAQIHTEVDASIAAYGIPDDLLRNLRRVLAPAAERLRTQIAAPAVERLAA
jgi:hypothetical protein